jgi:hypothetical protein
MPGGALCVLNPAHPQGRRDAQDGEALSPIGQTRLEGPRVAVTLQGRDSLKPKPLSSKGQIEAVHHQKGICLLPCKMTPPPVTEVQWCFDRSKAPVKCPKDPMKSSEARRWVMMVPSRTIGMTITFRHDKQARWLTA